jgi:hypothetical protein
MAKAFKVGFQRMALRVLVRSPGTVVVAATLRPRHTRGDTPHQWMTNWFVWDKTDAAVNTVVD